MGSNQTVANGDWVGLGTTSSSFSATSVVIPINAIVMGVTLSIRNNTLSPDDTVTATVFSTSCGYSDPTSLRLSTTLQGPSNAETPNCCTSTGGEILIRECQQLSVQITTTSPLANGVAVTILLRMP